MTYTLVLLRHGQSEGNAQGIFTGWADVPLTGLGLDQARRAGELLRDAGLLPDVVHTSLRRRAITTANLALDVADRHWIPVRRSWRLNERHYGALQGKDKKQIREEYGEAAFTAWRRSYEVAPPSAVPAASAADDSGRPERSGHSGPPEYLGHPGGIDHSRPEPEVLAEALRDVVVRALPYWQEAIVPDLRTGQVVLVAAHGNSIRALLKYIDHIDDQSIASLEIPNGIPLRYDLDEVTLEPVLPGGTYLDPEAAAQAVAAAAFIGR